MTDNSSASFWSVFTLCFIAFIVGVSIGARLRTANLTGQYCQQMGWEGGGQHSMCYVDTDAGKYQCELSLVIEGLCEVPEMVEGDHE